jgi:hypothetical protein
VSNIWQYSYTGMRLMRTSSTAAARFRIGIRWKQPQPDFKSINMINMIKMKEITKVRLKFNRKICTKFFYNFVQLFTATGHVPCRTFC